MADQLLYTVDNLSVDIDNASDDDYVIELDPSTEREVVFNNRSSTVVRMDIDR